MQSSITRDVLAAFEAGLSDPGADRSTAGARIWTQ